MFQGCSSLVSLNLDNFDTSLVYDMNSMFKDCDSLNFLDISNFIMNNSTSYYDMFSNISNIRYINLYNFKNNNKNISQFFYVTDGLYVCQKDKILDNTKIYNCCNYNFQANKCNSNFDSVSPGETKVPGISQNSQEEKKATQSPIINDPELNQDSPEDESQDNDPTPEISKKTEGKISIGAIIGIIAGIVVIIAIIIVIIYICKKRNKKSDSQDEDSKSTFDISISTDDILVKKVKKQQKKGIIKK